MLLPRLWVIPLGLAFCSVLACARRDESPAMVSAYPTAVDVKKVGTYPAWTKSGAGYFYDDVLEYRVWINPAEGGDDYYKAFTTYEDALACSKETSGADEPLVLILQREWIDEPQPGQYVRMSEERITEWQVDWLAGNKREPGAIERFLEEHHRTKGTAGPERPGKYRPQPLNDRSVRLAALHQEAVNTSL